jgi:glycosyltransferase involved in cell wall biosynthesis
LKKSLIVWQAHEANVSGANIALIEYVKAYKENYTFHIILPHSGSMCKALNELSVSYSIIPQYGWAGTQSLPLIQKLRFYLRSYLAVEQTKKLIKRLDPAFVFTNTLVPFVAAKAAYAQRVPHVWWIHEFGEEDFGFSIGFGNKEKAYSKMQQWSKLIICNSKAVAAKYQQLMPGANIHVNYQPVSWNKSLVGITSSKKGKFLLFGQIAPSKGHLEVIEAMALIKKQNKQLSTLFIIGPCENQIYYQQLLAKIEDAQLQEWVKIETGFFTKEEVLPQFEALIVASKAEAFGRVIIEAGKAGLKVVVKNNGGAPELINKTNGVLYQSIDELAAVLSGETPLPSDVIVQQYDEANELQKLKEALDKLV